MRYANAHCTFEVQDLDLSDRGFPGLSFSGVLHIERDEYDCWYIDQATAVNPHNGKEVSYKPHHLAPFNRALYAAIEAAAVNDRSIFGDITERFYQSVDG